MNTKIRKDDKVMVLAGKDKGKIGKVLKLLKKKDTVLVEGVNKIQRHTKANPYKNQPGGIVEKEAPVHISNVAYVCTACAKATRIGYKADNDGKKVRYCKKCNETVD
ncbi:MAG: 50S ribosomal protein L24 [Desulfovibrionaceae bacterium]|jgi:large subunit ribosomal protein L24|uniref:50S ribosomal protein L24 n=1 Tax=Desulfovibrio aminophilus TaxID=81425 RepID=UPI0004091FED|nr:50S ribosomal protein L24 [Desulfovibrio aminophilus]MDY0305395.1 50S ribosomal protein L24 [Desulfovibrionaceae bacterium]